MGDDEGEVDDSKGLCGMMWWAQVAWARIMCISVSVIALRPRVIYHVVATHTSSLCTSRQEAHQRKDVVGENRGGGAGMPTEALLPSDAKRT